MSNGVTGGIFATLADLQASKPRVNTRVELVTGERYSIDAADSGGGISVNGLFANEILNTQNVRMSKLDNPLCHLFKTNKLTETLNGTLTWTRSTTATYVDRYGVVKSAAIDTPREEKEGFLIEGASTNLLAYSEQLDNAAWTKTNATVTANAIASPDGATTADKVVESATTASHYIGISTTTVAATGYTASFFVKASERSIVWCGISGIGTAQAWFNASAGSFLTVDTGISSTKSTLMANGWYRVELGFTSNGTANIPQIALAITDGSLVYAGDGVSGLYVWGAQLEASSFASSYIPTTTTAVTRAADNVTLNALNNVATGTMSVVFSYEYFQGNANVYSYEGVNSTNNASFYLAGTTPVLYDGINTTSLSFDILIAEMQSVAIVYGTSTANAYQNGVLKSTVTMTAPDINQLKPFEIGSTNQGVGVFYGHIKDFRVYDFALNASEVDFLS